MVAGGSVPIHVELQRAAVTTIWRSEDVPPHAARWAMSPAGRDVIGGLLAHPSDADPLAVASRLRRHGLDGALAATAQGVATATRAARASGHPPDSWWTPAAAEQASHPEVARWRAARFVTHERIADVTAGCGGDARAIVDAAHGDVLACELDEARLPFLRTNLPDQVGVVRADAVRPPVRPTDWVATADPGRRVGGRRVHRLSDTRPGVPDLVSLGFAGLGIAMSPAVDLGDPDLPPDGELEFVQVGRALVEATAWLGCLAREPRTTTATLLPTGDQVHGHPGGPPGRPPAADIEEWLVMAASALVRARLADRMAEELGLARVAQRRALWTCMTEPPPSPWFSAERVVAAVPARAAPVRGALRVLPERPLEIVLHGVDTDVRAWWRDLGRPARGPRGRALHIVRMDDRTVAVLTDRPQGANG